MANKELDYDYFVKLSKYDKDILTKWEKDTLKALGLLD